METIESDRRFPFEYKLSPKASLDNYIADDLGVPLFSELVRSIIDELMTGEEGIEWYEVLAVQSRNQYRYFAPRFTKTLDFLNEDRSLYRMNKSILIKAVLSKKKVEKYSIVPIVGSSEVFFFPTRIAKEGVKKGASDGNQLLPHYGGLIAFMPWGVVSANSPASTPTGYGMAMCRCTSGRQNGNAMSKER